jgi:hypothetical protein
MSYDLVVFEPTAELRDRSTFMRWYESRITWSDGLDYSNASNATAALQAWYRDMTAMFPPSFNASVQEDTDERHWITEYVIAKDLIYAAFRWDKASVAYESVRSLAARHTVGFFDASGDHGAVWFPSANGALDLVHESDGSDKGQQTFAKLAADAQSRPGTVHCESMKDLVTQMLQMDPANRQCIVVEPSPSKKSQ